MKDRCRLDTLLYNLPVLTAFTYNIPSKSHHKFGDQTAGSPWCLKEFCRRSKKRAEQVIHPFAIIAAERINFDVKLSILVFHSHKDMTVPVRVVATDPPVRRRVRTTKQVVVPPHTVKPIDV